MPQEAAPAGTLTFDYPTIGQIADWLVAQQTLTRQNVAAAVSPATGASTLGMDSVQRLVVATVADVLGCSSIDADAPFMVSGARRGAAATACNFMLAAP